MEIKKKGRRQFIRDTGLGLAGAGLWHPDGLSAGNDCLKNVPQKVKKYIRLGRTGAMVSDIRSGIPSSSSILNAVL